jgi:hypothetical protein
MVAVNSLLPRISTGTVEQAQETLCRIFCQPRAAICQLSAEFDGFCA